MKSMLTVLVGCVAAIVSAAGVSAQTPPASGPTQFPVQVEVTLARYQGDKRVSSLPYSVSVNANGGPATLRMGANFPVPTITPPAATDRDPAPQPIGPVQYKEVGTNITAIAASRDGQLFDVTVSISDTSVYDDSQLTPGVSRAGAPPVFRTFQASNSMVLRDGQSGQFMAATDRISGETIRVEVTLRVVK